MEFKVITLRYSPTLGLVDDTPLAVLGREYEILALREHFFLVHDVPHLLCVASCERRAACESTTEDPGPQLPADLPTPDPAAKPAPTLSPLTPEQQRIRETLRRWRNERAHRDGVPPYVVLTNRCLDALAIDQPATATALRRVQGIGEAKARRYGDALLGLLTTTNQATPEPTADASPPARRANSSDPSTPTEPAGPASAPGPSSSPPTRGDDAPSPNSEADPAPRPKATA